MIYQNWIVNQILMQPTIKIFMIDYIKLRIFLAFRWCWHPQNCYLTKLFHTSLIFIRSDILSNKSNKPLSDFHHDIHIRPIIITPPQLSNLHFPANTFTNTTQALAAGCNLIPAGGNRVHVLHIVHCTVILSVNKNIIFSYHYNCFI